MKLALVVNTSLQTRRRNETEVTEEEVTSMGELADEAVQCGDGGKRDSNRGIGGGDRGEGVS